MEQDTQITDHWYKIYVETFEDPSHLNDSLSEAEGIVSNALTSSDPIFRN